MNREGAGPAGTGPERKIDGLSVASEDDRIAFLDLKALAANGIPPVEWLLEGWIAQRDIVLIAGAGGIGKSTAVADLAVALAAGRDWCGLKPERSGRVLYVDEEQDELTCARLFLRLGALEAGDNLQVAVGQGVRLDRPEGVARFEQAIRGQGAEVVVVDSIQQAFGATDENSATEVGARYGDLFRLRDRHGVSFVLVHHKKKSQGYPIEALELVRGSTAHGTQASCVIYAYAGGPDRLNLRQEKRRGAPKASLVVAYRESPEDDRIVLTGEGSIGQTETASDQADAFIVKYLADQAEAKTAALKEAGLRAGHDATRMERRLKHLVEIGRLVKPGHGRYRLTGGVTETPRMGDGTLPGTDGI